MKRLRAAWVITVSAACARAQPPLQEVSHNPPALPAPRENTTPTCPPREAIRAGAACETGLSCYLPTGGCQPSGFQCEAGRWREVTVTCNPPPPPGH